MLTSYTFNKINIKNKAGFTLGNWQTDPKIHIEMLEA